MQSQIAIFSSVVMVNRTVTCLTQGSSSVPSLPVCYVHVYIIAVFLFTPLEISHSGSANYYKVQAQYMDCSET